MEQVIKIIIDSFSQWKVLKEYLDFLLTILGIFGLGFTLAYFKWFVTQTKKLEQIEAKMLDLREDIDIGFENKLKEKTQLKSIFEGRLKALKEPAQAEYNKLELQRKFIIEKIPLMGILKK